MDHGRRTSLHRCVRSKRPVSVRVGERVPRIREVRSESLLQQLGSTFERGMSSQGLHESKRWSNCVGNAGRSREEGFIHFCKGIMLDVPSTDSEQHSLSLNASR